jgi:acyl-coenzyme A thioesterase PaaI-like protein
MVTQVSNLQHFRSIPWCAELLNAPSTIFASPSSHETKADTANSLFGETLNTNRTIVAFLEFYKSHLPDRLTKLQALVTLGDGLNGHPHVCHGGMVSTLLDEVLGDLLWVSRTPGDVAAGGTSMTAYLKVNYLKPVKTPQTVLITSTLREARGRKVFVDGTITDSEGAVLATGESLFLTITKDKIRERL